MTIVPFRRPAQGPSAFSYMPNLVALSTTASRTAEALDRPETRCNARTQWAQLLDRFVTLHDEVTAKRVDLAGDPATQAAYAGVVTALGELTQQVVRSAPAAGTFVGTGKAVADPGTIELDFVKAEGSLAQAQQQAATGAHPSTPRFVLVNTAQDIAHAINLADVSRVPLDAGAAATGSYAAKAYTKVATRLVALTQTLIR